MNPTLYINLTSRYPYNPVAMAIGMVAKTFGYTIVEKLVDGDTEANFAIVDTVDKALRTLKETENTAIILNYTMKQDRDGALAFASRNPTRVTAVATIGFYDGDVELVAHLAITAGKAYLIAADGTITKEEA